MVVADLHVHTTRSDGQLSPTSVAEAARRASLDAVAITDHDRLPPVTERWVERQGVTVIAGIELRVRADDQLLDLLGYGLTPTAALRTELERLQANRIERAREIVAQVEARLDVELDVSFEPGVGRPHIAAAIADSEAPYDVAGAFEHLIGEDGPCYVAREIPSFERGHELLTAACSLVSLAHPLRYDDPDAALAHARDLDAIELAYPYDGRVDRTPVERAIDEDDLLGTGGSDAHGTTLGTAGLDRPAHERFRARLAY
ncbi:PHP domain-containing protein [Halorhabdus sp. CUG00001]|uniref:PHP domain-containing protein n=1 Tax=Halorhabdus sp. CUG00001 TaxID=2600297 RepID=UPI00131C062C|nr:PHP domain-containing protein [Halorhabdus sp. CUG00001]